MIGPIYSAVLPRTCTGMARFLEDSSGLLNRVPEKTTNNISSVLLKQLIESFMAKTAVETR
jgi:hypothetical protein